MSDHSFTAAEFLFITKLVDRAERLADPRDYQEITRRVGEAVKRPDRTVGAAFMPRKRGGVSEWQAEQLAERNDAYRDLAVAEYGTALLTPKQARALARKVRRLVEKVHFMDGGRNIQQDAVRRIRSSGLATVGPRQLLRILPEKKL